MVMRSTCGRTLGALSARELLRNCSVAAHAIAKHDGTGGSGPRRRYADGGSPTMSRNTRLNVPSDENPTSMQMSVTDRSVDRSRNIARSTRRRCRYRFGVSPNVARNVRMKCASDT